MTGNGTEVTIEDVLWERLVERFGVSSDEEFRDLVLNLLEKALEMGRDD